MTTTMSHHKLSSSLSVKASVLTLVVMVAGVLFAAAPSSAMAQQITATSSPGLPLPMSPPTNETGGGGIPTLLPPTNGTGDTPFLTNETGGITPPLANETGGITPPLANETGGITPPLANETGGITPPPTEGVAEPLTAEITANTIEGDAPLTVELSAIVAGGTEPYTYSWDFGDGSPGSDQSTVQHIFENPAIYTVTVTVTDTTGQAVTPILEITVYEPPAEAPPAEAPPAEAPPAEAPPAEEPSIPGT
jgi:PKD repeat protein